LALQAIEVRSTTCAEDGQGAHTLPRSKHWQREPELHLSHTCVTSSFVRELTTSFVGFSCSFVRFLSCTKRRARGPFVGFGLIRCKFCRVFRLRSYDPGNTQPRPILEVKQSSALISSMVGDHIRTERDVVHPFCLFLVFLLFAQTKLTLGLRTKSIMPYYMRMRHDITFLLQHKKLRVGPLL
jgi:hypothetical protein